MKAVRDAAIEADKQMGTFREAMQLRAERRVALKTPIVTDDEFLEYLVDLLWERGEPTAAKRLSSILSALTGKE